MRPAATASLPSSPAEYVNMREPSMDMKSVTDRAAQTLLWTELVRGGPWGEGGGRLVGGTDVLGRRAPSHRACAAPRPGHDPELPVPRASHHQLPI